MLLAGGRLARRQADPGHPFGHGRVRYLAAFLVAVVLFTLGSLFSLPSQARLDGAIRMAPGRTLLRKLSSSYRGLRWAVTCAIATTLRRSAASRLPRAPASLPRAPAWIGAGLADQPPQA